MVPSLKWATIALASMAYGFTSLGVAGSTSAGQDQRTARDSIRRARFTHDSVVDSEMPPARAALVAAAEAPTGFENLTNGFTDREGVREFHAFDHCSATRCDHRRRSGRGAGIYRGGVRHVSCGVDYHGAGGHVDQRRRDAGSGGAGEQDHSPLQRLPSAQHRNGRRDSHSADTRICSDGQSDAHSTLMGFAYSESADARRPVVL